MKSFLGTNFFVYLFRYFVGLQKCLRLYCENGKYKIDDIVHLDALYKSLREQYPQSAAVKVPCFLQQLHRTYDPHHLQLAFSFMFGPH